ncbi:MAG: hypothetical protein A3E78_17025 [Alphaproteobacteria bacterium RIFCSPHIGHO2_12_FULL_63_12]|nr:MAG: hypothetical protein A3E78_17025 [Alphaproteobacteria bacterium RIFCSPHIGHO2_12_FULL_63_12]
MAIFLRQERGFQRCATPVIDERIIRPALTDFARRKSADSANHYRSENPLYSIVNRKSRLLTTPSAAAYEFSCSSLRGDDAKALKGSSASSVAANDASKG